MANAVRESNRAVELALLGLLGETVGWPVGLGLAAIIAGVAAINATEPRHPSRNMT